MTFAKGALTVAAIVAAGAVVAAWAEDDDDESDEAAVKALATSKHTLAEGLRACSKDGGVPLSAKCEVGEDGAEKGKLMLSVYAAKKGLMDNPWKAGLTEIAGVATDDKWTTEDSPRKEGEDLAYAAQQETLLALTDVTLADVVAKAEKAQKGTVLSVHPELHSRKPVFAVHVVADGKVSELLYDLKTGEPVASKSK